MKIVDRVLKCKSRSDIYELYPIGDAHIGARNCAEKHLRKLVKIIADNSYARWIGGGDLLDCIKPQDKSRFDIKNLPDWYFEGDANTVKEHLADILSQQLKRLIKILSPIKGKCLGLIQGNHEYAIAKHHNENIQKSICNALSAEDLTDVAFLRLRFVRPSGTRTIKVVIQHGYGGGRTAGAEPNKLDRFTARWQADIYFTGHTHTFTINPPKIEGGVPSSGKIPDEVVQYARRAANWGCWVKSYATGPPAYDSMSCYPFRPLSTVKTTIQPFRTTGSGPELPLITMTELEIR